jgi:hypothetical protein
MLRFTSAAWEQEVLRSECGLINPAGNRVTRLRSNLELDGLLRFSLHHDRSTRHEFAMENIAHSQLHEVTGAKLAVDGEVEHRELARSPRELQPYPDRPDVLQFQR